MNLIEKATVLALEAHGTQTRKDAPTPYIVHPIAVALLLSRHGFNDTVIAAALVHDVVEDTDVSLAQISESLGEEVAALVAPVTHDDALVWEEKKLAYIEAVRRANDTVKAIATADKIANAHSLLNAYEREGKEVWRHFNAGRDKKIWFEKSMLAMLQESWDHPLVVEYAACVTTLEALV